MDSPEVVPEKQGGEILNATQSAVYMKWFLKCFPNRSEVPEKQGGGIFHS